MNINLSRQLRVLACLMFGSVSGTICFGQVQSTSLQNYSAYNLRRSGISYADAITKTPSISGDFGVFGDQWWAGGSYYVQYKGLVLFNVSSIPAGSQILSATLHIHIQSYPASYPLGGMLPFVGAVYAGAFAGAAAWDAPAVNLGTFAVPVPPDLYTAPNAHAYGDYDIAVPASLVSGTTAFRFERVGGQLTGPLMDGQVVEFGYPHGNQVLDVRYSTRTLTPQDVLNGAVHFQITNGGMTATFTPNYNLTLAEAATICGVNHFNWIQWIYFDNDPNRPRAGLTQVSPPYIDPPLGGYVYSGLRDFSPAYWEETPVNDPQYYVGAHTDNINNILSFADYPTVTPGSVVQFRTALAGVKSDGTVITFSFLPGENWQSQSTGTSIIRDNINTSVITNANASLIGTFVFSSINGTEITYLQSQQVAGLAPLITGISRNTNGSITLSVTAIANSTNRIWSATNAVPPIAWQTIGTNVAGTNGLLNFTDTNTSGQKIKFYRISTP